MKKSFIKKIIAFVLVVGMTCQPVLSFAEEESETTETQINDENGFDLRGAWFGSYDGSDGSSVVKRRIALNVYECDIDEGSFAGIAKINSSSDGQYYFTGMIDYDTREVSFSGEDWIINPNSFQFSEFSGIISESYDNIAGTVDSENSRSFSLKKTSDDFTDMKLNSNSVILDWTGEYDGRHDDGSVVRRNYEFHIQHIDEDGTITGIATFSPSDKAATSLGANGSYLFSGSIDFQYGGIRMQGYEWTDYPDKYDDWSFVELSGIIDTENGTIEGTSENGIWSMTSMDYITYDTDSDFTLDKDNNGFANSDDVSDSNAGFVGVTDYHLDSDYFDELIQNASFGEINKIKRTMNNKWNGSGYGVAVTMALLYEGYLSMDELSSESADSYYDMAYPYLNSDLLNNIMYYQLSQSLINGSAESAAVSRAYNYQFLSGLTDRDSNYDSLSVCLQQLVNYASDGHVELLVLSTKESSDAVLVKSCLYEADSETYRLEIYDINSSVSDDDADPLIMEIEKDFSAFDFTDARGETITNDNYVSVYFLDWEAMDVFVSGGSDDNVSSSYTYIEFPLDSFFALTTSDGDDLSYDGKEIAGSIYVYDIATIAAGDSIRIILATDDMDSYELTDLDESVDIEIYNKNDYMSLSGSQMNSAEMSFDEGISIQGTDYDFEAYITTNDEVDKNETGLVSVSASAAGNVEISKEEEWILVISKKQMINVEISNYIGITVNTETNDELVYQIEMSDSEINYTSADAADLYVSAGGDESMIEAILQQLEDMQANVDELNEEIDALEEMLEENESELD